MKTAVKWAGLLLAFIVLAVMIVLVVDCCILKTPARAHDTWISRGNLKNLQGEWCCGIGDCGSFDDGAVKPAAGGFQMHGYLTIEGTNARLFISEFVPYADAQPSQNGKFVRCHDSKMERRCFFAPIPSN